MSMMPPLSTPRLDLHPIVLQDMSWISAIISHPLFANASLSCQMPSSETQLLRWILTQQKQHHSGQGCCYALRDRQTEKPIGMITLQPQKNNECELSYWLHPDHWRQGIMTEALIKVLKHWQIQHPQQPIRARVHPANIASISLLVRVGMKKVETEITTAMQLHLYEYMLMPH
ncbi:GNAT family N-acetyltransferase [Tolumonas lignilytica]|uniref:GNAT family N-acetyltransferase n=1 Tax=Tolumonas lignilytica TaxID=1283284 RepID=UPI0009DCEB8D|nr:GNAT family N-acetyltransferase [Tolumonas lignilytica]